MKKTIIIILLLAFSTPVYALTGISLGVKGGISANTDLGVMEGYVDIESLKLIGGQLKISTLPMVDLIGTVEYAWAKKGLTSELGEFKFHDLGLTASLVYPVKTQFIKPYAGFGIGTHALAYSIEGPMGSIIIPEDKTYFGYHLIGGFDIGLMALPFSITGEVRINWIKTNDEMTKYFQMTAGINYSFL